MLSLLVSYLAYKKFGFKGLFSLLIIYIIIEFLVKFAVDLLCYVLQTTGLTNSLLLSDEGKLRRKYHSGITFSIVVTYLVFCVGIFTLFFILLAVDMKKLQTASFGLFRLDKIAGIV